MCEVESLEFGEQACIVEYEGVYASDRLAASPHGRVCEHLRPHTRKRIQWP